MSFSVFRALTQGWFPITEGLTASGNVERTNHMTATPTGMKTRFGLIVGLALTAGLAACADDKMAAAPAAAPAPVAAPAPAPMTAKEKTAAIQSALNKNGAKLKVDGVAGKKTAAAIASYQKAHKLKVTGKADDKTSAMLMGM